MDPLLPSSKFPLLSSQISMRDYQHPRMNESEDHYGNNIISADLLDERLLKMDFSVVVNRFHNTNVY